MISRVSAFASMAVSKKAVRIERIFFVLVIAMIFFQKLGLNFGDAAIGLDTILMWIGFVMLIGSSRFNPARGLLLCLMVLAILGMMVSITPPDRPTAFGIVAAAFIPFMLEIPISEEGALRCFNHFQRCMSVIAVIVLVQQGLQYTVGNRYWPNLETVIPESFLYPGFAYIHPYAFGSPYLTPNGVFFLEPSALSYYLSIALIIEIIWFKSFTRFCLFAAALGACMAVTGIATVLLSSPFWISRVDKRIWHILIWGIIPLILLAAHFGALDHLFARSDELSDNQSSGYARIMLPLQSISDQLSSSNVMFGHGAGSTPRAANFVEWPFSKLLYEYGIIVAILFHAYLLTCMFGRPLSRALSFSMLLPYLFFGGGFVSHASVMPLILFGSLLSVSSASSVSTISSRIRPDLLRPPFLGVASRQQKAKRLFLEGG